MQLDDFEKESRDDWKSKEPVATVLGDLFVELSVNDREGPPDETMLKLASELAEFAQNRGVLLIDSVYAHYREAERVGNRLDFWDVPKGLGRDDILSHVEYVTLSVSRDLDSEERPYDACVSVSPNWDLEHGLFLRYDNGQLAEFDPMGE